jgi:hypothetical protein
MMITRLLKAILLAQSMPAWGNYDEIEQEK